MRRVLCVGLLVVAAIVVTGSRVGHVSAEGVIARALDASILAGSTRLGDYTWLEDAGMAIQLPAAPRVDEALPALLAARRLDDTRNAALWEIGTGGFGGLQRKLEAEGARFSGSQASPFRPRGYPEDIAGQRSNVTLVGDRRAVVLDWRVSGRHFAIVVGDASNEAATRRLDELVREMVVVHGLEAGGVAPLMLQGRYACVMNGWQRDGERLRRRVPQGWLGARFFTVAGTDFESVGRLQFELESQLDGAGFRRSAGLKPMIAGAEGFVGEYFGNDGFVQRIAYGRLDGGYLVVLMQGPEAARAMLGDQMDALVNSVRPTGLGAVSGPPPIYFNHVRSVRVLAWQDGRRVLWGVLFDDGRQQPVVWRQDNISWRAELTKGGQTQREKIGESNSSRALNPLVDADLRSLDLPEGANGEMEVTVEVNGIRASTRIQVK